MSWGIDDYDPDYYDGGLEDEFEDEGCIYGDECLQPHPWHSSDECCTTEMVEAELAEFEKTNPE